MLNAFQWNCFNLVYTCNIALILFLKCSVTKFRIPPPPLSHFVDPLTLLNVWRNLWMAPKYSILWAIDVQLNYILSKMLKKEIVKSKEKTVTQFSEEKREVTHGTNQDLSCNMSSQSPIVWRENFITYFNYRVLFTWPQTLPAILCYHAVKLFSSIFSFFRQQYQEIVGKRWILIQIKFKCR